MKSQKSLIQMLTETQKSSQVLDRIVFIFQSILKAFIIPWNNVQNKFSSLREKENSLSRFAIRREF